MKKWWQSKTIWSGIGTVAIGVTLIISGNTSEGIASIVTGLGSIFGRVNAVGKIQ